MALRKMGKALKSHEGIVGFFYFKFYIFKLLTSVNLL